ncbi:hypothetical protein K2X89_08690, partial [Myxococcota bacterium]|nr:hypothetical protein [Myxococcota bacterium]
LPEDIMTTDYLDSSEFKQEHAAYLRRNPKAAAAWMQAEPSSPEQLQPVATAPRTLSAREIIEEALALTLRMLAPSNPNPSEIHKSLLRATLETLVRNAFGELDSRVIIGLPTGAGKTTCIAAAIFTLHKHGLLESHPVLALAEQIKAGAELRDLLIEGYGLRTGTVDDAGTGIPEHLISHVYSADEGGDAPEVADVAPVCIATHKRTRMVKDIRRLLDYQGTRRACWIDEGILASSAFGLRADSATEQFLAIQVAVKSAREKNTFKRWPAEGSEAAPETPEEHEERLVSLMTWASKALAVYEEARTALREAVAARVAGMKNSKLPVKLSHRVSLPEPSFDIDWAIGELKGQRVGELALRILEAASVAPDSFTLVSTGEDQTVLQHRRILPKELDHGVVVLDAGAEVDALQRIDRALINAETLPWWPTDGTGKPIPARGLKDWSNVELHWMKTSSGKVSLENRGVFTQLSEAAARFIADHARAGDEILVCTYRSRKQKLSDVLPVAVRKLRADLTVACDGDTRPDRDIWIRTTHWGLHHSTNAFQQARIVIGLGDFPISKADIEALILGQASTTDDENSPAVLKTVREEGNERVLNAYCATKLLQLAGRGRSRQVVDGKAKEMIFAFTTARRRTADLLSEMAMKGCSRVDWKLPEKLEEARAAQRAGLKNAAAPEDTKTQQAFAMLLPKLEALRTDVGDVTVSSRSLRATCGLPGADGWLTPTVLKKAIAMLEGLDGFEVVATGRSDQRSVRILAKLPF